MNATAQLTHSVDALQPLGWFRDWLASDSTAPAFKLHVLLDGETIEITQPMRHPLLCAQGSLWITHDGWPQDHIVEQGQRYQATTDARMLVHALGVSRVQVSAARA